VLAGCFGRRGLLAAGARGCGEPEPLIDSGEYRGIPDLPEMERGLPPLFRPDADREPLIARILVHKLSRRAFIGGQQPPLKKLVSEFRQVQR
jgi:hypothetical protein